MAFILGTGISNGRCCPMAPISGAFAWNVPVALSGGGLRVYSRARIADLKRFLAAPSTRFSGWFAVAFVVISAGELSPSFVGLLECRQCARQTSCSFVNARYSP